MEVSGQLHAPAGLIYEPSYIYKEIIIIIIIIIITFIIIK
jgi:hypothetical protein